jgi:nicotinamide-nucleotide amidase
MTNVELITIGDELLIGQVINTNASFMGRELNAAGFLVKQITSVSDKEEDIIESFNLARKRAKIILITGGLGPTKDDITKHVMCKYFKTTLIFDQIAYADIENIFKARGREISATNRKQAELPASCIPLYNKYGTAPGMWFEEDDAVFVSMPGVPYEMKSMMTESVLPKLIKKFPQTKIIHKTILTQGIGESFLSDLIAPWEDNLPASMKLAYLPAPGMVRLRLTCIGNDDDLDQKVTLQINELLKYIAPYVFGVDEETINSVVGKILRERKQTLSTAESCTGGYLSHLITSIPGSSDYYIGSIVCYENRIKTEELNVDPNLIAKHGAVSEEVVREMADGIRKKYKTDFSIATSGIAGPGGATEDKPLGTVWIAIASQDKIISKKFMLGTDRLRIIHVASETGLNMLRKLMLGSETY